MLRNILFCLVSLAFLMQPGPAKTQAPTTNAAVKPVALDTKKPEPKQEQEKYLLRFRFHKEDVFRWNVLHTLQNSLSVSGQSETTESTSLSTKVWTILDVAPDGTATFEYHVDYVDMKSLKTDYLQKHEEEHYDSRKDNVLPASFLPLEGSIGVPLAHLKINVQGEMLEKKPLRVYSDANRENRIAVPLPENPVAVGESWNVPLPLEIKKANGMIEKKVNAQERYTLESVDSGVARIRYVTQMLSILTPKEESQLLDHFGRGYFDLDIEAGHIIRQETTIERAVVGLQGSSDNINFKSRQTECCCGLKSCELCTMAKKDDGRVQK